MSRIRSALPVRTLLVTVCMVVPVALSGEAAASHIPPTTTRVSVTSSGGQVDGPSFDSDMSAGIRYVVFSSDSSGLVPNDTNGVRDVFVRDRMTNTTVRVSKSTDGTQGNNDSSHPSISADGRYVAFISEASNLTDTDGNQELDVFVRDRKAKVTKRVSIATGGEGGNDISYDPAISGTGRYVAFNSDASNLVPDDTNGSTDVFVRDLEMNVTRRVSISTLGAQANGFSESTPAISADGQYIAFQTSAPNLVANDTNQRSDVFVRDRTAQTTRRVSVNSAGVQGNDGSYRPDISADGTYVAFSSDASNLVGLDTNGVADVFVRDIRADETIRVSVSSTGAESNNSSSQPSISAEGTHVAFVSRASNLVPSDANGKRDVFLRNWSAGVTERVSVTADGAEADGTSDDPNLGADASYVSFTSRATNLVANDTNNARDVFVRTLGCCS